MQGALSNARRRRLGEILMDAGVVSDVQLQAALAEQKRWGGKLGRTLVEMGFVDEESMTVALSRQLQLPQVDLDRTPLPAGITEFLRVDMAERYGVFPVAGDRKQKTLTLATSDPTNMEALQELAFYAGMRIQVVVASASGIDRAIRHHYYGEAAVSTPTTTPDQLGVREPVFDLQNGAEQEPERPHKPAPQTYRQVLELQERVTELERLLAGQIRATRALVELLVEKSVLAREEFISRARTPRE
jgi:type IV pilus assembly protein PilB